MESFIVKTLYKIAILFAIVIAINCAPTKWGIVGAGRISNDFAVVINSMSPSDHQMVAIAARNLSSAEYFAEEHNISKAYGSYEELAYDTNVQVVYVGVINPAHLNVSLLMLEHGKHLLVEKPLAMNAKEVKILVNAAKAKKLFLMEALWTRFLPSFQFAIEQIRAGVIGDVYHVSATFGVRNLQNVERLARKELGGGTILDLGVYVINIAEMVFADEKPLDIKAVGLLNADGVDVSMSAALLYKNGRTATIGTHGIVQLPNEYYIGGTNGTIRIVTKNEVFVNSAVHYFPFPKVDKIEFGESSGMRYEFDEVRQCILAGKLESDIMSHNVSIQIATIEDELRRQIGVVYDADY